MANKITYTDKVGITDKTIHENQFWDDDANEIKEKHNLNDDRITAVEDGQLTGVASYATLAILQASGSETINVVYKVTNDSTSTNNGYYHWDGADYIKDASLAIGTISSGETEAVPGGDIYDEIEPINEKLDDTTEFFQSVNLFDNSNIKDGQYLNSSNGDIEYSSGWGSSDYIPVSPSTNYTLSGTRGRRGIAFYSDKSGTAISSSYEDSTDSPLTVVSPATAVYCRFNVYQPSNSNYSLLQFEEGLEASSYVDYKSQYVIKEDALPVEVAGIDYNISVLANLEGSTTKITTIENKLTYEILPFKGQSLTSSQCLDFRKAYYDGNVIHTMSDECAPYRVFGTTLGANHGYAKNRIVSASHDKTYEDVGSIWTDGSNQYVITGIETDVIEVSARYSNSYLTAALLTHVSGATHTTDINSSSKTNAQMYPSIKNYSIKMLLDGSEIDTSGQYYGQKEVVFKETYDIMEKTSIMEWLILQVGTSTPILQFDGDGYIRVTITYQFNKNGVITIYTDFLALENVADFQDIMFNMNEHFGTPYSMYIPKTLPFTHETISYDFTDLTDITTPVLTSRIDVTPARCDVTGILADRNLSIRSDAGLALGYLPVQDTGITRRRVVATNKTMQISTSKKVYMSCIDSDSITSLSKGDYYSTITYKAYFPVEAERTAYYIVPANNKYYLYIDWHTFGLDQITLPDELNGIDYTVIEKSDNVSILTPENTGYITFETFNTDNYAYCILEFVK